MEFHWKRYPEKFSAKASVNWMYDLVEDLEVPTLEEQGVSPDMIECLSKEVMKAPQTFGNPRGLNKKA